MTPRTRRVDFPSADGRKLTARMELPAGTPKAYALFAHCLAGSGDVSAATRIAMGLAARGVAVLCFDFAGSDGGAAGEGEGTRIDAGPPSDLADLVAAADSMRREGMAPKLLIGHSLGGAAMLAAAAQMPEAVAVATIGAPADPAPFRHLLDASSAAVETAGGAEIAIAGRWFRIKRRLLEDIAPPRLVDAVGHLGKALIVFHAPRDVVVPIDSATRIFVAARHPKSFVSLDRADHLLSRREDADYVAEMLAAWASRYLDLNLDLPAAPASLAPSSAPRGLEVPAPARDGEVVVAETRAGRFTEAIAVGRHRLAADEPVSAGGTDTGPGPYDFLLSALGACTAMTLRFYADQKKMPLERVTVRLHHDKIHAADCADCETREGLIDLIERVIDLAGPLDPAQRRRLLEIADKCPVHNTLTHEIRIRTSLSD